MSKCSLQGVFSVMLKPASMLNIFPVQQNKWRNWKRNKKYYRGNKKLQIHFWHLDAQKIKRTPLASIQFDEPSVVVPQSLAGEKKRSEQNESMNYLKRANAGISRYSDIGPFGPGDQRPWARRIHNPLRCIWEMEAWKYLATIFIRDKLMDLGRFAQEARLD